MIAFPEAVKVVELLAPAADAAGRTSAIYPSLKNVHRAWIVAHVNQGNAATVALTPKQASAVAGTGTKVLANAVPIWAGEDLAASDALPRQADGTSFTTDAEVKHKIVVFQIDPAKLDVAGGFDCIGLTTGASSAANITSAVLIAEMRYGSAAPPSLIVD
jgi:hypothetical protein